MEPLIIIPVFNGAAQLKRLINSPGLDLKNRDLLIIDDGSTCPDTLSFLRDLGRSKCRLIIERNVENIGFVRSVNRGMKLHSDRDVILLNSDTIPSVGWFEELVSLRRTLRNVGTISPISNAAGFFSVPRVRSFNQIPGNVPIDSYPDYLRKVLDEGGLPHYEVSPVTCGFCQLITAEVRESIGVFDEFLFHRGYAEESDFCLRAESQGWVNVIALSAFVFHERGATFGARKVSLKHRNSQVMKALHPNYVDKLRKYENGSILNTLGSKLEREFLAVD